MVVRVRGARKSCVAFVGGRCAVPAAQHHEPQCMRGSGSGCQNCACRAAPSQYWGTEGSTAWEYSAMPPVTFFTLLKPWPICGCLRGREPAAGV